jgi:hypothetical protein
MNPQFVHNFRGDCGATPIECACTTPMCNKHTPHNDIGTTNESLTPPRTRGLDPTGELIYTIDDQKTTSVTYQCWTLCTSPWLVHRLGCYSILGIFKDRRLRILIHGGPMTFWNKPPQGVHLTRPNPPRSDHLTWQWLNQGQGPIDPWGGTLHHPTQRRRRSFGLPNKGAWQSLHRRHLLRSHGLELEVKPLTHGRPRHAWCDRRPWEHKPLLVPDVPSLCSQPNHSTAWEPSKGTVPPWDIDHNGEWGTPSANVATRALGPRQRESRRSPDHSPSFLLFCFSFFATPWTIKRLQALLCRG